MYLFLHSTRVCRTANTRPQVVNGPDYRTLLDEDMKGAAEIGGLLVPFPELPMDANPADIVNATPHRVATRTHSFLFILKLLSPHYDVTRSPGTFPKDGQL